MRKLFAIFALLGAVGWCAPLMAQDKPAAPAAAPAAPAPAAAAPAAAAPAAAPSATPTPAPTPNKGDVAWMLTSTALVLMMSVPALALFYGGLVRSKNMLSTLMQVFVGFSLITVLWCIYGYSLAFTEGNSFFGSLTERLFLRGTFDPVKGEFANAATFSKNTPLPELVYVAFQATFAAITCCLILGATVERIKFSAVLIFLTLWFTFSYTPVAHMVWFFPGPAELAFMKSYVATACAVLSGMFGEWVFKGKPSMVGAASGAVAGLVAITPAAGNVGIPGAFVIGTAAGLVCLWGVNGLKKMLGADDALDVFGVHAVGGILGALLTGVFNSPDLGGPGSVQDWVTMKSGYPGIMAQLWIQAKAVGLVFVWTAVVAFISFKIADLLVGLRVTEEEEREGLDINSHGETAYRI